MARYARYLKLGWLYISLLSHTECHHFQRRRWNFYVNIYLHIRYQLMSMIFVFTCMPWPTIPHSSIQPTRMGSIYIVINRQMVWLYQTSSLWLDMRYTSSWDQKYTFSHYSSSRLICHLYDKSSVRNFLSKQILLKNIICGILVEISRILSWISN